ncbi:MAG: plasmid recombination protein [Eubacterium sp.]|nr:plasmid recombination protein [Eubacterium sp.]
MIIGVRSLSHCQGKGCLSHNNRDFKPKNVDSRRTKNNVTFVKERIGEAYEKLFGAAVERYNARQKRSDRKIKNGYYEYQFNRKISQSVVTSPDKRKSFYEDVVQIGTKENTGVGTLDGEIAARCLTEYMNGFQERNPNFYVFNAVLHMDEATPHLHIDYIPVGHYKRGVDTQNGIAQALKEMGFGEGKDTVARWRKSECDVLKEICGRYGITVSEPQKSRGTMTVENYKEVKRLEDRLVHLSELSNAADGAEIPHKKSLFVKNQVVVSTEDFEKVEAEKKTAAVQLKIAEQRTEKAAEIEKRNQEYSEWLNVRGKEVSEKERLAEEKLSQAENLLNRQTDINKILDDTERERDIYKRETERIRYLQFEIQNLKSNAEKWRNECSNKSSEIAALNAEITKQSEKINYLRKLYSWVFDIAKYACQKLKMDVESAVKKRSEGYRTAYIFGDEKKRSR